MCDTACSGQTYGINCSQTCSPHCLNDTCDFRDGFCMYGCAAGYSGFSCDTADKDRRTIYSEWAIIASTIFSCLIVLLCTVPYVLRNYKTEKKEKPPTVVQEEHHGSEGYNELPHYEDYDDDDASVISYSVLGEMVSGMFPKGKKGIHDDEQYQYDDFEVGSDVDSAVSGHKYDKWKRGSSAGALGVPKVGRKTKRKKAISDLGSEVDSWIVTQDTRKQQQLPNDAESAKNSEPNDSSKQKGRFFIFS